MALSQTINKGVDPISALTRVSAKSDILGRAQAARAEIPALTGAEAQARETAALEESQLRKEKAQAETAIEQDFATKKRSAVEEFQTGIQERPRFNPTEFDATSAGELAGLTAIIGTIAGRGSARAALKSMSGFTKGAREGRVDLYNREIKKFEDELGAWKDGIELAKTKLTQVIDLLGTDKNAALVKAKELEPMLQEGLVLAKIKQGNYKGALDDLKRVSNAGDQAEIALAKATSKGGGLKPSATERDRYSMQYELLNLGAQINQRLADPKLKALINQPKIRAGLFMQEESKLLDQFLQPQIPQDVRQLAILIKKYRNMVYRAESGLAVTAYEAMRQYGANPQPGSTAEVLLDQINVLNDVAKRSIRKAETIYPELAEVGVALQDFDKAESNARNTGKPKIASKADVEVTARDNKISIEDAKTRLRFRGFQIEGEE